MVKNGFSQNSSMAYYHPYKLLVIITLIFKGKPDKKIFLPSDLLININEIGQYGTLSTVFSQYFHMWNKLEMIKSQRDAKIEEHSIETELWHYQCNELFSRKCIILNIEEYELVWCNINVIIVKNHMPK